MSNFKRYDLRRVTTGISDDFEFVECDDGEFVSFDDIKEFLPTIVQQSKAGSEDSAKICPKCDQGKYKYWNGSSWVLVACELCGGSGKLLPC